MKTFRELYYALPRLRELAFSGPPLQRWREKSVKGIFHILKNSGIKKGKLLEVGCGAGFLARKLGVHFPSLNILAIDISPELINWAKRRKNPPNVNFMVQDFLNFEGEFDVVISMEVMPVIGGLGDKFLDQFAKVTKPGGLLILTHLRPNIYTRLYRKFWKAFRIGEIVGEHPEEFLKKVEKRGFSGYYYSLDYLEGKYMVVMRRGGRVDEGARFEIAYPRKRGSWVRIPPPPP